MWFWQNYLTSSSLSLLINKMRVMTYVSYINMCKFLFSIVVYVLHKGDSISDSSLPTGSKRVLIKKSQVRAVELSLTVWINGNILLPVLIHSQVAYALGKQLWGASWLVHYRFQFPPERVTFTNWSNLWNGTKRIFLNFKLYFFFLLSC